MAKRHRKKTKRGTLVRVSPLLVSVINDIREHFIYKGEVPPSAKEVTEQIAKDIDRSQLTEDMNNYF